MSIALTAELIGYAVDAERARCLAIATKEIEKNRKCRIEAQRIVSDDSAYYLWAEQTAERIRREIEAGP